MYKNPKFQLQLKAFKTSIVHISYSTKFWEQSQRSINLSLYDQIKRSFFDDETLLIDVK